MIIFYKLEYFYIMYIFIKVFSDNVLISFDFFNEYYNIFIYFIFSGNRLYFIINKYIILKIFGRLWFYSINNLYLWFKINSVSIL